MSASTFFKNLRGGGGPVYRHGPYAAGMYIICNTYNIYNYIYYMQAAVYKYITATGTYNIPGAGGE